VTTDLREALRGAVVDAPNDLADLRAVVAAGSRRVRRRVRLTVGSSVLTVAAVVGALVLSGALNTGREPLPSKVVHLDLTKAERLDLDVLASVQVTWREYDAQQDKVFGITPDGLLLRGKRVPGVGRRLGLFDPQTGSTGWLPTLPWHVLRPRLVGLTRDAVVLFDHRDVYMVTLLGYDRASGSWRRGDIRLPPGIEVHQTPSLYLGDDGRVYVGSRMEGAPEQHWWSSAWEGGALRPEPSLTGLAVAWDGTGRATAAFDGQVSVSTLGAERVVSRERPDGCAPDDEGLDRWSVWPEIVLSSRSGATTGRPRRSCMTPTGRPSRWPAACSVLPTGTMSSSAMCARRRAVQEAPMTRAPGGRTSWTSRNPA
jgi:hypothetical protein